MAHISLLYHAINLLVTGCTGRDDAQRSVHFAAIIEAILEHGTPRKIYIDLMDAALCAAPSSTPLPSNMPQSRDTRS
ncbi:hypothetical protein HYPSUDRAFT_66148 [Hypholoma sublateritium FD-334 SS-4]|uniref:Uncharacterized protein n=1 Tax=Hypholoma sublateritium (strain FD-334 SS-4) TaxID=945553 RepID=A0A0D2L993_HYPSF|nr:hypothetical protein HYPSUDRAFT_66148 [Hypholoma sublateritium FD-334 SS-4]